MADKYTGRKGKTSGGKKWKKPMLTILQRTNDGNRVLQNCKREGETYYGPTTTVTACWYEGHSCWTLCYENDVS